MRKCKPKNVLLQQIFLILSFIFFSKESRANAILPIFNYFNPISFSFTAIITILLIFFEAALLKEFIKQISFRLSLWRVIIINIISSIAGAILNWSLFENGTVLVLILIHIIMLCIEMIVLKFLYQNECLEWARSINISIRVKLLSYLFVFSLITYIQFISFLNQYAIEKWNYTSLVGDAAGFIYTIKYKTPGEFVLNRYNIKNKKWESLNSKTKEKINPLYWDIKGNFIACIFEKEHFEKFPVTVFDIITFSKITEINGNFKDIRISPDLSKLAVLEYVRNINAPITLDLSFSKACNLKIYDLLSGILLYEAPRLVLDEGLTWTNNSNEIIFSSLRDESLFNIYDKEPKSSFYMIFKYCITSLKLKQFPVDLFIYNLQKNTCVSLIEGRQPDFISSTNELFFIRKKLLKKIDIFKMNIEQKNPHLIASNIIGNKQAVSPDGKKCLISIPHQDQKPQINFLTVVDLNDTKRKFIIDPNCFYSQSIWMKEDLGEWS